MAVPPGNSLPHGIRANVGVRPSRQKPDTAQHDADISASTWRHKLSLITTVTMILSSLVMPLAVLFLCFLWSNLNGGEVNNTWRRIVTSNWMVRSITITASAIRNAGSAQAAIATSMLASIVLERHGIPLYASTSVSVLRYVNSGPPSLLLALRGSFHYTWTVAIGVLFLSCTTLLLQFTSTALAADLGIGSVVSQVRGNATLTGVSFAQTTYITSGPSYWTMNPQTFPTFAEYHENASSSKAVNTVRDTGTTLRAMVPFANALNRTSIKQFNGTATVIDSRVTCIRPEVHPGLTVALSTDGWLLNGTFVPETSPPGLILSELPAYTADLQSITLNLGVNGSDTSQADLNWNQQLPYAHDDGEWNIIQKLMWKGPALVSSLDPRYPSVVGGNSSDYNWSNPNEYAYGLKYTMGDDLIPLMTGRSYLLINVTISENVPQLINGTAGPENFFFSPDQDLNKLIITTQDEWVVFTIPRLPGWLLSASLCYDSFTSIDANVSLVADDTTTEPSFTAWNASAGRFGTEAIRQQLGASNQSLTQSPAERGIMTIQTTPQQLRNQVQTWYDESKDHGWANISFPNQNFVVADMKDQYTFGAFMCIGCGVQYLFKSKIEFQDSSVANNGIFQDVMIDTRNTALAFQAYYTSIGRMAYYDILSYFDIHDQPKISWFQSAQFPRSFRGLAAVIVVLCIHTVLMILITVVFLTATKVSRLGDNAWQSLAQTFSPEMEELLRSSTMMKDGDVKKEIDITGRGAGKSVMKLATIQEWPRKRIGLTRGGAGLDDIELTAREHEETSSETSHLIRLDLRL